MPPFVNSPTFCASRDGPRKSDFLRTLPINTKVFLHGLSLRGKTTSPKKIAGNCAFSAIIELKFGKEIPYIVQLKFGKKIPYIVVFYPQFSFWIPVALAKICFSRVVVNRAKNTSVLGGKSLELTK